MVSIGLFSSLLILSSANSNLLLSPSSKSFTSFILLLNSRNSICFLIWFSSCYLYFLFNVLSSCLPLLVESLFSLVLQYIYNGYFDGFFLLFLISGLSHRQFLFLVLLWCIGHIFLFLCISHKIFVGNWTGYTIHINNSGSWYFWGLLLLLPFFICLVTGWII